MRAKKNRKQNISYLHGIFIETKNIRAKIGTGEKEELSSDPFAKS